MTQASQLYTGLCSCWYVDKYVCMFFPSLFHYGVGLCVWCQFRCECHCEVGIGVGLVGFLTTHVSMSHCSAIIAPCLCSFLLWRAAVIDSSQSFLVWSGCPKWWLSVCDMSPKLVLANWPGPIAYVCVILSFVSHLRIASQFCSDLWIVSFHCSHMSHAMFHYFFIISDVQHWLDFLDFICFQIWSCCHLHSMLNHPSQMWCIPILFCSSRGESCVVDGGLIVVQVQSPCMSWRCLSLLTSASLPIVWVIYPRVCGLMGLGTQVCAVCLQLVWGILGIVWLFWISIYACSFLFQNDLRHI